MSIVELTYVDWRPISSVPISHGIMRSSDGWIDGSHLLNDTLFLEAGNKDLRVEYRYVCRYDGIILFTVRCPQMALRDLTIVVAYPISQSIKETCGHVHVFDVENWQIDSAELTSLPVLTESRSFADMPEMISFAEDNGQIGALSARSVRNGSTSERPALLTIKMLYSKLFDRVSERIKERDQNVSAFGASSITRSGRFYMFWGAIVSAGLILMLLFLNEKFAMDHAKEFIVGPVFLFFAMAALIHVRENINFVLAGKIRLHRKLIAFYSHANNLSRVLWKIYPDERDSPSNDFDPIISLTNNQIDATARRINSYSFFFTALVSLVGIFLSIVV